MRCAAEMFDFEKRPSESQLVAGTWETQTGGLEDEFLAVAVAGWEIVVTRQAATTWVTVRGPEATASVAPVPQDAAILGITFGLGTYMPCLDLPGLVGRGLVLPPGSPTSFWLDGAEWELPQAHNVDVFVDRLVRAGLLVHDPLVPVALAEGRVDGWSTRSVERRVARATGLPRGTIRQIHRAERAVELLAQGMSPLEVARRAGYTDQPHLTRSLRRFVGRTPAQLTPAAV